MQLSSATLLYSSFVVVRRRSIVAKPARRLSAICKWIKGTLLSSFSRADNARSLNDIESTLPAESEAKEAVIDQAIVDRAARFLSTHTVELSLPEEVSRSFDEGKLQISILFDSIIATKERCSLLRLESGDQVHSF